MNVKEAEKVSGISGQNIRYYEKEGLIIPKRNPVNSYRDYDEENIRTLKIIRMLRMLDMPIEQIRLILEGNLSMEDGLGMQKAELEQQTQKLQAAILFCENLEKQKVSLEKLDVDACLKKMDQEPTRGGYFIQWMEDYKTVAKEEHQRVFTFMPDGAVTNPREFTDALLAYAKENNLDMIITKEGMYPEFTIDGVEYRAERNYGRAYRVPVAVIHCEMIHPELYEGEMPDKRRRIMKILHHSLPAVGVIVLMLFIMGGAGGLSFMEYFTTKEGMILLALMVLLGIGEFIHWYLLYRNMDGKQGKKQSEIK